MCFLFGNIVLCQPVLQEIVHGSRSYGKMNDMAIAMAVVNKGIRPQKEENMPDQLYQLMSIWWGKDPTLRPKMTEIILSLNGLSLDF